MSFAIIAVGAVAVGAAVYKGVSGGKALSKAEQTRLAALDSLKPLDAQEMSKVAGDAEIKRFTDSIASQRKLDPDFARMREQGGKNIVSQLQSDANPTSAGNSSLKEMRELVGNAKGSTDEVLAQLMDRVKADLDAGATLPPEFQAELVRSGMEKAGASGLDMSRGGDAGANTRRLLGSEGLALKMAREANAVRNLGAATNLRNDRSKALIGIAALDNDLKNATMGRAGAAISTSNSNMPSIGLSGADAADIYQRNAEFENKRILERAKITSDTTLAKAANNAQMAGGIASGVSSAIGGYAGAAGGAAGTGSGGGGFGSWLSGLFGGTKTVKEGAMGGYG